MIRGDAQSFMKNYKRTRKALVRKKKIESSGAKSAITFRDIPQTISMNDFPYRRFHLLSIKGKITERWLVESFTTRAILENFENSRAINP